MTLAKIEAERLINKFTFANIYFTDNAKGALLNAKFCAESCIDEIIKVCPYLSNDNCETSLQFRADKNQFVSHWEEVKYEIQNYKGVV